jgi:hypothetical protein
MIDINVPVYSTLQRKSHVCFSRKGILPTAFVQISTFMCL